MTKFCRSQFKKHNSHVLFVIGGMEYSWCGWYGCQLESWEWFMPPPGTTRTLNLGVSMNDSVVVTVNSARREGLKVRVTWAVSNSGTLDEHSARINKLRNALKNMI